MLWVSWRLKVGNVRSPVYGARIRFSACRCPCGTLSPSPRPWLRHIFTGPLVAAVAGCGSGAFTRSAPAGRGLRGCGGRRLQVGVLSCQLCRQIGDLFLQCAEIIVNLIQAGFAISGGSHCFHDHSHRIDVWERALSNVVLQRALQPVSDGGLHPPNFPGTCSPQVSHQICDTSPSVSPAPASPPLASSLPSSENRPPSVAAAAAPYCAAVASPVPAETCGDALSGRSDVPFLRLSSPSCRVLRDGAAG